VVLAHATWPEVDAFPRSGVVLIPTGSLEQHGPHLPLFTDTLLVTAVAERVERALSGRVLLTPTLWLGASGHHLAFPGSLNNAMASYMESLASVIRSLTPHGFHKFYVLNGHGGNTSPNDVALRQIKEANRNLSIGHAAYCDFGGGIAAETLEGPLKQIAHACEEETSLMLHVHPELVRLDRLRDDGLTSEPPLKGMTHMFEEITEQGSYGYATYATAEKGRKIFDAYVAGVTAEIERLADGYVLRGL